MEVGGGLRSRKGSAFLESRMWRKPRKRFANPQFFYAASASSEDIVLEEFMPQINQAELENSSSKWNSETPSAYL